MDSNTSFQLRLTPGELVYAAGLFGIDQIPLIEQPFSGWTELQIRAQMLRGKQLLEERGWIRPTSGGKTEIDEILAGLIRLAAMPDYCIEITTQSHYRKGSTALILPLEGGLLVIQMDGSDYLFSIYATGIYDPSFLLRQMGVNQQEISKIIPAPISRTVFSRLAKEWFVNQISDEQCKKMYLHEQSWINASLSRLEFLASLSLIRWENGKLHTAANHVYAGNTSELWQVSSVGQTDSLEFLPVSAKQVLSTTFFK
jgi:hypothetical protein